MSDEILYVVGGIVIGLLVFTIAYRLLTISTNQAQKQIVLSDFNDLSSTANSVCLQEIKNSMIVNMEVPESVRVIYATNDSSNPIPTVTYSIKNNRISSGKYLCLQFKTEQEIRCHEIKCKVFFPFIGSLETYNDLQLMVNKILGRPLMKEYKFNLIKTNVGVDVTYDNYDSFKVPILVISYIPVDAAGNVNTAITGDWRDTDLNNLRNHITSLNNKLVESLTEGSRYHGYKNAKSVPSLNYYIIDQKEFLEEIPASKTFTSYPDYFKILKDDTDVCNYVDNGDVKEIWIWMYHSGNIIPIESNMAMGYKIEDKWNLDDDGDGTKDYGDVSTSLRQNDLPICQNTYTVYSFDYGKDFGIILGNHTHQTEALITYFSNCEPPSNPSCDPLWQYFSDGAGSSKPSCGSIDCPPNLPYPNCLYKWDSTESRYSDCEDWKPDNSGQQKQINCRAWYKGDCLDNNGIEYKIWWMQNIPGKNNNLKTDGKILRDWWEFIGNFDDAIIKGRSLKE